MMILGQEMGLDGVTKDTLILGERRLKLLFLKVV
jgi:hypothetical protein